jgi:DnaJ-class molecular chaperone
MKTTTSERYELCKRCGGGGSEIDFSAPMGTAGQPKITCHACGGGGHILVERTVTTESIRIATAKKRK